MNTRIKFLLSAVIIIAVIISSKIGNDGISLFPSTTTSNNINSQSKTLKIGYFPNLNHAQAVIGLQQQGDFQKMLNANSNSNNNTNTNVAIKIEPYVFTAGPSAIEALYAGQIDASYVGPNPAINGYLASHGQEFRIVSGAASGGASFVIRNDAKINSVKDLGGKKFASPQLGNTQDVALRKYLQDNGFKTIENGGNITIIPVQPADILTLFLKKEIDGAWVPEPWATRLVKEANGKIFVDERNLWPDGKFVTANIIVRTDYLKNNPDVIKKLLAAHVRETQWINGHKQQAIHIFNEALKNITGKTIAEDELKDALSRLEFTYDPIKESLFKMADNAYDLGFLGKVGNRPNLSGIYDLTILNDILSEKQLHTIK